MTRNDIEKLLVDAGHAINNGQCFVIEDVLFRVKSLCVDLLKAGTFAERNRRRCEAPNGFNHRLDSWSLADWMTAVVGEVGEAANIVKKLNRVRDGIPGNTESDAELRAKLAEELADAEIYLDLMFQAAGINRAAAIEAKFAKTSAKIGYQEAHG